jgi:hypothetical protein
VTPELFRASLYFKDTPAKQKDVAILAIGLFPISCAKKVAFL